MSEMKEPTMEELKLLLSEDASAKLNEVSALLARISTSNDQSFCSQEFWSPLAVVEGSFYGEDEVYGVPCHYYYNLCKGKVQDFGLLVECLVNIPSSMVVHDVLWLLAGSLSNDDEIDRFVHALPAIGKDVCRGKARVTVLAMRAIVERACEKKGQSQSIFCRFIEMAQNLDDKSLLMCMLGFVVYELRGDNRKTGQKQHDELVNQLESIRQVIIDNNCEIEPAEISYVFGISTKDGDLSRICRETGNPAQTGPLYAQALITCVFAEINLADKYKKEITERALEFPDTSYHWKQGNQYVLPVCIGRLIANSSDAVETWQELRQDWEQLIYRDFHEGGTSANYYLSSICDLYLRASVNAVTELLSHDNEAVAENIWKDAWNDCVTILWSRLLPDVAKEVIQYLFVIRALHLSHMEGYDLHTLVNSLPFIESRSLGWIDCGSLCQSALKMNCSKEEYSKMLSESINAAKSSNLDQMV
jgi:hypothetical protein